MNIIRLFCPHLTRLTSSYYLRCCKHKFLELLDPDIPKKVGMTTVFTSPKTVIGQFGEESLAAAELRRMLAEDPTI
jgi:hypothetical protein